MWSNRLLGPLRRLRETVTRLANGEQVGELNFRSGDFLKDVADDVNQVARRLEELGPCIAVTGQMEHQTSDSSDEGKCQQGMYETTNI